MGNVVEIPDLPYEHSPDDTLKLVRNTGALPKNLRLKSGFEILDWKHLAQILNKYGIDTLMYKNRWEDPGNYSYMITRPDQVRLLQKTKSKPNFKRGFERLAGS